MPQEVSSVEVLPTSSQGSSLSKTRPSRKHGDPSANPLLESTVVSFVGRNSTYQTTMFLIMDVYL